MSKCTIHKFYGGSPCGSEAVYRISFVCEKNNKDQTYILTVCTECQPSVKIYREYKQKRIK